MLSVRKQLAERLTEVVDEMLIPDALVFCKLSPEPSLGSTPEKHLNESLRSLFRPSPQVF
jgi:hypothetical protein